MNVAADMAVWCRARATAVGVRWVLLVAACCASGLSLVVVTAAGVRPALPSGFGGSCISLVAACMSAAFICVAFLSLLFLLFPITEG